MSAPHFELMISEAQRTEVYRLLEGYGLLRYNLHAWAEPTLANWLEMTNPDQSSVWLADGWGTYYLTPGIAYLPLAHFAVWPQARPRAAEFIAAALAHGFEHYPVPRGVLALTPRKFRHVWRAAEAAGFELLTTALPGAVSLWGEPADGALLMMRRDTWERTHCR